MPWKLKFSYVADLWQMSLTTSHQIWELNINKRALYNDETSQETNTSFLQLKNILFPNQAMMILFRGKLETEKGWQRLFIFNVFPLQTLHRYNGDDYQRRFHVIPNIFAFYFFCKNSFFVRIKIWLIQIISKLSQNNFMYIVLVICLMRI